MNHKCNKMADTKKAGVNVRPNLNLPLSCLESPVFITFCKLIVSFVYVEIGAFNASKFHCDRLDSVRMRMWSRLECMQARANGCAIALTSQLQQLMQVASLLVLCSHGTLKAVTVAVHFRI